MLNSMNVDRVRLSELKAQIAHLESSLSALRAEEALVQKRLNAYKYPILTLPNEITSEIFIHFLPVYPAAPPLIGVASPTCLTHVCRQWRDVALATPALWRAIEFVCHSNTEPEQIRLQPKQIQYISNVWIQRSKSCLLSIHLNIDELGVLDEIFPEPLAPATARWEHLKLRAPFSSLHKIDSSMPMLRSFDFVGSSYGSDNFTFDNVPRLRTVALHDTINIDLPWIHLIRLSLICVRVDECVRILGLTRNLLECSLIVRGGCEHEPDVVLPSLERLILEDEEWSPFEGILHLFIAPRLRTLDVMHGFLGSDPIDALESFISKSGCKLQEVRIHEDQTIGRAYERTLERYLRAFSSIPSFSFHRSRRGDHDDVSSDESDSYEGE
ncbi:F-box domain-containing protein [Mycena sanguinolenta]|uniref:F-box domain-containing protein n=1 Tax=Mycena sanguinolenta TaxID=230812 RepID=A0A8H7DKN4_9AGAR|nr:F-box domain-containing protein [Mycena sanguinolenta]